MKDYYKITQVHPKAETRVVERMRKVLARIYHPDSVIEPSKKEEYTKKMQEINEAFDVLTDESKRREYDKKYCNDREANFDYGPIYRYRSQFDKSLHPYLESSTIFGLSKREHGNIFESQERKHLYYMARKIESNKEFTPWQKTKIVEFINRAKKNELLD